jgi:hypothetical protein
MDDIIKKIAAVVIAILSGIYLLNLTCGILELPDNLPIIGNLDEVVVAGFFFAALRFLGLDLAELFKKQDKRENTTKLIPIK